METTLWLQEQPMEIQIQNTMETLRPLERLYQERERERERE